MNDFFLEHFKRFKFLKIQDLAVVFTFCTVKSFEKGEIIAREGDRFEQVLLVRKGIIRTYLLTPDGEERTIRLAKEKDITSCAASFLYGKPSTEYLAAIEDAKVILVDTKRLREASQKNLRILRLVNECIKEALAEAIMRVEFFTILTPEQRYKRLMEEAPELIQRVPQKFLASYLGITTVSLSRIKSRLSSLH